MNMNFYAIVCCTVEEFNNDIKLADPNREGYYANAKKGIPLDIISHNGEIVIALGYSMKSTFKN